MAHVDNLRRNFPALRYVTYLNTGSYGCLPDVSVQAMQKALEQQLQEGRNSAHFDAVETVKQQVREELGRHLGANAESFALTHNTTEALNLALWGLNLRPGDELLLSDIEHPAALLPAITLRLRQGIQLKQFSALGSEDELLRSLEQQVTPHTKAVICSHVSASTGHVLPIARISEWCRAHRVLLIVDGAQSAGAIPIDLTDLQVDFYAFPGQKWLSGPDGTGALYMHPRHLDELLPTIVGRPALRSQDAFDRAGYYLPAAGASRFEHDSTGLASWQGWLEALRYLRVTAGLDYVYSRIHGLSGELFDGLLDLETIRIHTPREARAGLIHFELPAVPAAKVVAQARERQIDIRATGQLVRVSTGWYNTSDDLERLFRCLKGLIGKE